MILPKCSDEQLKVIESITNYNVLVDSVAGSGKTTTNLYLAKKYPKLKFLLLTYNAKLKIETRQKVKILEIDNMEIHSYHSLAVKYYDKKCYTDTSLKKMLKKEYKYENKPLFEYDVFILDESQDMTPLYYELFCKIYQDNRLKSGKKAKICLLGDRYQSIYQFNSADSRFITEAPKLFNFNKYLWKETQLTYSFRVTHEIAQFVNKVLLNEDRLKSKRVTFNKPKYIITDCFGSRFGISRGKSKAFKEIKYFLQMGYLPHEIFVLAPSVKNAKSPIRQLENDIKLLLRNIPVYVPVSDEEKLDHQVLENKLVFSTFHQAKGLERKVVIVFNFDASYFKFFKKNSNPNKCSNELYVATTRAKEHLVLLHHYQNDFLPFLNTKELHNTTNFVKHYKLYLRESNKNKNRDTSVTDLVRHLTQDTIDKCLNYVKVVRRREISNKIHIKSKTQQKYGYENVSEITGTAIPAFFEYKLKNSMNIYNLLGYSVLPKSNNCLPILNEYAFIDDEDEDHCDSEVSNINNIDLNNISTQKLLYLANKWCSYKNGFIFKLDQIENYNWLSEENLEKCIKRLNNLGISSSAHFEVKNTIENKSELFDRKIIGYFDCIDKNKIYEFKCVNMIKKEHILQLSIYAYLDYQKRDGNELNDRKYYIYNVLTDELLQIKSDKKKLEEMIYFLLFTKYFDNKLLDNISFVNLCDKIRNKYFLK